MRDSFGVSRILEDQPKGEAKWVATFTTGGVPERSEPLDTAEQADSWLADKTRAFLAEPVVMPAPDGDGVVVGAALEERVVFQAPAVAVHVGHLSPLLSAPVAAARIAERLHYARRLVEEAAKYAACTGGEAIGASDVEGSLWGLEDRLETMLERLGCEVLAQAPVAPVAGAERRPAAHLTVVPDVAPNLIVGHWGGA